MRGFSFSSLRARLVLLVLLAIIPAMGLILYTAAEQRRWAAVEAQENALRLARSVADSQDDLIDAARLLLTALAQMPIVDANSPDACSSVFSMLLKKNPDYANLGAVTPAGDPFCSGLPLPGSVNVADRAWFRRAVESRDFVIGDYIVGRVTGKATIGLGYPVLDEAGEVQAVLYAGLDLAWFNKVAAKTQLPTGATLTVIDRNGTILVRLPDPEKWVGKSMPETSLVQTILRQGEGTAEAPGVDGLPRLYGFSSLGNTRDAYVSVGVPKDVAFARANRILARNLVALGLVAVLALLAAWLGSDLFVLRRVNSLVSATKQLSRGDLSTRTGWTYGQSELGQLARSFDEMAETLQIRQAQAEWAEKQIQRQLQELTALREIEIAITSTLDLHAILDLLLEKIDLFFPHPVISAVRLVSKESGLLEPVACRHISKEEWMAAILTIKDYKYSFGWMAMQTKAPIVISNIQTDPRTQQPEFYRKHRIVSLLGIPLIVKGHALGVLYFYTREEHQFSNEEIEFLSTLAGQAAIAIYNSQLYEQTKNQAAELEKADKVKDEFLGFVSHELKTPVNAVMGYTGMLEDGLFGEISPEQRMALEKVTAYSKDLLSMIDGLLHATRIGAGAVEVEREEIALVNFLDELKLFYSVPLNKELTLIWNYQSELPAIKTDREKLKHILQNLISNAIKYTDKGNVTISVRVKEGKSIEFTVVDTGIGIPKELLPVIFEMFRQVKFSKNGSRGGVGLGLHIVQKFAELLGGTVEVESELGKGSTFTVTIPSEIHQSAASKHIALKTGS